MICGADDKYRIALQISISIFNHSSYLSVGSEASFDSRKTRNLLVDIYYQSLNILYQGMYPITVSCNFGTMERSGTHSVEVLL
jgi:hypothetical protein